MADALYPIADWDDAYANAPHIPDGAAYPARWVAPARDFRNRLSAAGRAATDIIYGPRPRNRLDVFYPEGAPRGLVVYVHGGFWKALDKSYWSHLAQGSVDAGYCVAMPSYTLCPEARISEITNEIAAAIEHAARDITGEIILTGHSAGGHLVTRMICENRPLPEEVAARIARVVSISGVHDLRPLLATRMNADFQLGLAEASAESPALLAPRKGQSLTCWVGCDERPEFIRQSRVMADMWKGFDARVAHVEEPGRHHFDVIDGLMQADHPLMQAVLGA